MPNFYLTASSRQQGALSLFHVYGAEEALFPALDAHVSPASLVPGDLRYGWLRDGSGEALDEILLACPSPGSRVLMTHGGRVIREETEAYLERRGFAPLPEEAAAARDSLLEPLLAHCVTEGQAAAVLRARATGDAEGLADALRPRRVVLAGAPNAGKSSLLNALAGYDRAFVDAEAGATRDVVDELIDISGYAVWIGDLPGYAGAAAAEDSLSARAWANAVQRMRLADEVWFVVDGAAGWTPEAEAAASAVLGALEGRARELEGRTGELPVRIIVNKTDLPLRLAGEPWKPFFPSAPVVFLNSLPDGNARSALAGFC